MEMMVVDGQERLMLTYGHHKNSARTSKPIPCTLLPMGEALTLVLAWWLKVGHVKLRSGTMVSDDEVRAPPPMLGSMSPTRSKCVATTMGKQGVTSKGVLVCRCTGREGGHPPLLPSHHEHGLHKQAVEGDVWRPL